jgi:hypothetical protein
VCIVNISNTANHRGHAMDELLQLRDHIEHGRYAEALTLIGEMEEMSRDDKIQKIESYLQVLRQASLEAFEGRYDDAELAAQIDAAGLKETALALVSEMATT